jgi:hypothetical protein
MSGFAVVEEFTTDVGERQATRAAVNQAKAQFFLQA